MLIKDPHEFLYPDELKNSNAKTWEESIARIKEINIDLLSNLRHNANIYAIHKRISKEDKWQLRKSDGMKERITQHLIDKNQATGSKLNEVKEFVRSGGFIGVSFLKIEPESLRLSIEEHIICKNKDILLWNRHGKG